MKLIIEFNSEDLANVIKKLNLGEIKENNF